MREFACTVTTVLSVHLPALFFSSRRPSLLASLSPAHTHNTHVCYPRRSSFRASSFFKRVVAVNLVKARMLVAQNVVLADRVVVVVAVARIPRCRIVLGTIITAQRSSYVQATRIWPSSTRGTDGVLPPSPPLPRNGWRILHADVHCNHNDDVITATSKPRHMDLKKDEHIVAAGNNTP